MSSLGAFLEARDFLQIHRTDYETAYREFRWPKLDQFNWALDYFDVLAQGNGDTALQLVDEAGEETRLSFRELAERSNRVANYLRAAGARRGDRILVMLGNEPALWETLLGAFKLGAVVIPAASLLGTEDLCDRLERGAVRLVVAGSAHAGKFASLEGGYTRIAVVGAVSGWRSLEDAGQESARYVPDGPTRPSDPLLLYFTSGTTSRPKLVEHSHESYPVVPLTSTRRKRAMRR